jgi:hypothetical protein
MNHSARKVWQILGRGEGFVRDGLAASFDLSGFVWGTDPDDAWQGGIAIARSQWSEIAQADLEGFPCAVINADEIEDASRLEIDPALIDQVELTWENDDA